MLPKQTAAEGLMRSMADVIEARGKHKWMAEGMAKGLLMLLAAKGLHVDDASRQIIESCRSPAKIERWLNRALVATRIEEVLETAQRGERGAGRNLRRRSSPVC